ncbi:hypothetical protein RCL1_005693 [Eukaryota sp. TZLM3-RCL]
MPQDSPSDRGLGNRLPISPFSFGTYRGSAHNPNPYDPDLLNLPVSHPKAPMKVEDCRDVPRSRSPLDENVNYSAQVSSVVQQQTEKSTKIAELLHSFVLE